MFLSMLLAWREACTAIPNSRFIIGTNYYFDVFRCLLTENLPLSEMKISSWAIGSMGLGTHVLSLTSLGTSLESESHRSLFQ